MSSQLFTNFLLTKNTNLHFRKATKNNALEVVYEIDHRLKTNIDLQTEKYLSKNEDNNFFQHYKNYIKSLKFSVFIAGRINTMAI